MDFINTHIEEHVFFIGLNRTDKMNAFNWQMLNELSAAYEMLGVEQKDTDSFAASGRLEEQIRGTAALRSPRAAKSLSKRLAAEGQDGRRQGSKRGAEHGSKRGPESSAANDALQQEATR